MDLIIQNFLSPSVAAEFSNIIFIASCIFALIECFFGYRIIRSVISIIGFILGVFCGYSIVLGITGNMTYALIGALIGGILICILSYKVYLGGVFILSAYAVFSIAVSYVPATGPVLYVAAVLLGLLAGYLGIHYMRPAIIIITALHGGLTAVEGLPMIVPVHQSYLLYIGLGLAAAGIVIQFLTSKE